MKFIFGYYYDYRDYLRILSAVAKGGLILVGVATVLSIPGWIASPIWGWHWFFPAVLVIWGGLAVIGMIGAFLYFLATGID